MRKRSRENSSRATIRKLRSFARARFFRSAGVVNSRLRKWFQWPDIATRDDARDTAVRARKTRLISQLNTNAFVRGAERCPSYLFDENTVCLVSSESFRFKFSHARFPFLTTLADFPLALNDRPLARRNYESPSSVVRASNAARHAAGRFLSKYSSKC